MDLRSIIPEGMRDLVLNDCTKKRFLEKSIDELFESWGYKEVITPTIEFYSTFNSYKYNLKEEEMYKFFDNKGKILILRPDMTIPIARLISTKLKGEKLPIRIRYKSNVFRFYESLGGKRNEYTDCGIELVGNDKFDKDLEALVLSLESLKRLNLKSFKLEVGSINIFYAALNGLNMSDTKKEILAKLIEDKKLKNLGEFLEKLDTKEDCKNFFYKLPWLFGSKDILKKSKKIAFNNEILEEINYLEKIYESLKMLGYEENISFDLGMVPRLNYYTGIIFRGYGEGIGDSILSGGRYDSLINANDSYLPAVGFSIDIDLVVTSLKDMMISKKKICKIYYGKDRILEAIKKSEKLRLDGKTVELFYDENLLDIKIIT